MYLKYHLSVLYIFTNMFSVTVANQNKLQFNSILVMFPYCSCKGQFKHLNEFYNKVSRETARVSK